MISSLSVFSLVARVTLARKLAALTLRLFKTGEVFDPTQLSRPQTLRGFIVMYYSAYNTRCTSKLILRRGTV